MSEHSGKRSGERSGRFSTRLGGRAAGGGWTTRAAGWLSGWRGALLAVLLLVGLVASLHREVLFAGAVYHMDDAADCYYPGRVAYRRALSEGSLPSWEPNTLSGWPLLADPYYGYFYPPNFVFYLGPRRGEPDSGLAAGVPSGLGLSVALHAVLAGAAMYAYLRRRRSHGEPLSFGAAVFGAVCYALSSFFVVRIRHVIFIQILAWLPLVLLFLDDYLERRRRRSLALCGLLFGLMLLTGAHSILHFVVLLLLLYGLGSLASLVGRQPAGQRLRLAWSVGWPLVLTALAGALLGAVALLPTLSAMPNTTRALGTDYTFASSYAWPSLRYLQLLLAPDALGVGETRQQEWFGPWNHWELAGYYQGLVAALLAVPGAFLPRRGQGGLWRELLVRTDPETEQRRQRWRRLGGTSLSARFDGERLALLLCLLFGIALALGDHGPLHPLLYRYFPLYAALRCPSRGLILYVVAAPILAAHAIEYLFAATGKRKDDSSAAASQAGEPPSFRPWAALLLAALFVGAGSWLAWQAVAAAPSQIPRLKWAFLARAHLTVVLALFSALLTLRWVGGLRGPLLLLGVVALSAGDQFRIARGYVLPQPIDYPAGMERFHAVQWLLQKAAQPPPGQAVADRFVADPRGPFRLLAVGETLGLPSASGYGSVQIWRYAQLLYILRHGRPYPHRRQVDDMAAAGVWNLASPLVDMLNLRYLVWTSPPSEKWRLVYSPPPGEPGRARFEPVWDSQLRVFENSRVLPRAYVAYQLRLAQDEADEARLLAQPDFDPHRQTLVGKVPALARRSMPSWPVAWPPFPNTAPTPSTLPPIQPAPIVQYERHRVVIEAEAQADGLLVLADAYYPGWSATVDGIAQPIYPVNLAFRGVPLNKGKHRIEFRYDQQPLRLGARLSALGLLLLLLLWGWPLRRRAQQSEGA